MERRQITRDEFLSFASQTIREDVPVPELGPGAVLTVWQMTAREKTDWETSNVTEGKQANTLSARERMFLRVCRDDAGVRVFSEDDVTQLSKCRVDIIDRVLEVAYRLNSTSAKEIEELSKN